MISASPQSGSAPVTVTFFGTSSYDPDGTISTYAWEFGDGATGAGPSASHTYNAAGIYTSLLRVTDNAGATASVTQTITVTPLPAPVLSGSVSAKNVSLAWTDPSGGSATGWSVERKPRNGSWVEIAVVNTKSLTDMPPRGVWVYRVRSFNAAGLSAYSNEVSLHVR